MYDVHEIYPIFNFPTYPCPSTSKILSTLDLGRPILNKHPLQMITNQLKENMIQKMAIRGNQRIIKGWLHHLTSESKGRHLVIKILMLGTAWCLVMAQTQFSLIRKRNWMSRTFAITHPPTSKSISFLPWPLPHTLSSWMSYVYRPLH